MVIWDIGQSMGQILQIQKTTKHNYVNRYVLTCVNL